MPKGVNLKTKMEKKTTKKVAVKLTQRQRTAKTIKNLSAKTERTAHEGVLLANAIYKTETKTLNFVYVTLKREFFNEENTDLAIVVREIVGANFPTRAAFLKEYKANGFHIWGGLQALKRLNPKNKLKAKIERQNKAVAKK